MARLNWQSFGWFILTWLACSTATCLAQLTGESQPDPYAATERLNDVRPLSESEMPVLLPESEAAPFEAESSALHASPFTPESPHGMSREMIRKLMRPTIKLAGEWLAEADDVEIATFDAGITVPTYPIFGPPPPMLSGGFNFTTIDALPSADLPDHLYETQLGLGWMRRFNERWLARFMAGVSYATDGNNQSGDVWRFRGGAFAIYRRNPQWTWTFGAIALGRNDLPVVPAVGVVYQPHTDVRFDLIMPKPRIAWLLRDLGGRQRWGYIGAGINGATWGVERHDGVDDQLTYGDIRAVIGWESVPTPEPGLPFSRGRKIGFEAGYAFSRDFEWEYADRKLRLDDTVMLRGWLNF